MIAQDLGRTLAFAVALAVCGSAPPALAQPQTAGVAVAGGIGAWERAQLSEHPAPDRNVKLVFALDTGNYVADVHVKVIASGGEAVVDGVARGPWVHATLAAGRYTLEATYADHTVTRRITIADHGRRLVHVTWPAGVEDSASADSGVAPILGTGPQRSTL